MDLNVLKKKLKVFSTEGKLRNVSDEVVMELLRTWEKWPEKTAVLYRELGLSKMQFTSLIKKGKNLVKSGKVVESGFKEVLLGQEEGLVPKQYQESGCENLEVIWLNGAKIRFQEVDQVIDFLKKVS